MELPLKVWDARHFHKLNHLIEGFSSVDTQAKSFLFYIILSVCLSSLVLYSPLFAEATDRLTFLIFSESIIHFNSEVLFDSLAIFLYFKFSLRVCVFKKAFLLIYSVYRYTHHRTHMEVKGQSAEVSSLLTLCGAQGSNLCHQAWWQVLLPVEPPHSSIFCALQLHIYSKYQCFEGLFTFLFCTFCFAHFLFIFLLPIK